jgi:hypothetical protein
VQHQRDGKLSRDGTINLIQEFAALDGAMAQPALTDQRSCGDIQRSEEAGGAMALVNRECATVNLAGQHRKDRLPAAQRPNLTLLVHAQHQCMSGGFRYKPMMSRTVSPNSGSCPALAYNLGFAVLPYGSI